MVAVRLTEKEYARLQHLLQIVCQSSEVNSVNLRALFRFYENLQSMDEREEKRAARLAKKLQRECESKEAVEAQEFSDTLSRIYLRDHDLT